MGGNYSLYAPDAFVYSRSYFSAFINNTSSHFKAAAFTVFLNALGRCIGPSVLVLQKILFSLLFTPLISCIQPLCNLYLLL